MTGRKVSLAGIGLGGVERGGVVIRHRRSEVTDTPTATLIDRHVTLSRWSRSAW